MPISIYERLVPTNNLQTGKVYSYFKNDTIFLLLLCLGTSHSHRRHSSPLQRQQHHRTRAHGSTLPLRSRTTPTSVAPVPGGVGDQRGERARGARRCGGSGGQLGAPAQPQGAAAAPTDCCDSRGSRAHNYFCTGRFKDYCLFCINCIDSS